MAMAKLCKLSSFPDPAFSSFIDITAFFLVFNTKCIQSLVVVFVKIAEEYKKGG